MIVYSLYILNKAGGLIYQNDINPGLNRLSANDYLVLAGTLHGVHAITSRFTHMNQHDLDLMYRSKSGAAGSMGSGVGGAGTSDNSGGAGSGTGSASNAGVGGPGASSTSGINSSIITSGQSVNPNTNRTGLQSIETDHFNLYVFQTLTGIKFILITSPVATKSLGRYELNNQLNLTNSLFKKVYITYSDYVMKDPFYSLDMPIKNGLFDTQIRQIIN